MPSFTLKVVCILFACKHCITVERYLMPFIDACSGPTAGFIRLVIEMQYLLVLKNNLANIASPKVILC
jgi:Trk-type K+ transport system membrane component